MPHLHLSESNLKCVYIAAGFPENRSKFLIKMKDKLTEGRNYEQAENDEEEEQESAERHGLVSIPGKEGQFKHKVQIHEKYECRPDSLKNMCLTQFAMYYDTLPASKLTNDTKKNLKDEETHGKSDKHKIILGKISKEQADKGEIDEEETELPTHIKLQENLGYMRLRNIPAVPRFHKFKEDKDAHEFYYSQLFLYHNQL